MAKSAVPSLEELEELVIRTLASVVEDEVEIVRQQLLARGPSMPANSYQLVEVVRQLSTILNADLDVNKFEGYLRSVKRTARKLHEILRQTRRQVA